MTGHPSTESRVVTEEVGRAQDKSAKGLPVHQLATTPTDTGLQQPGSPPETKQTSRVRRIAALMIFESITLAAASALHLSGLVHGRSVPYNATGAGVAEAVIGAVLFCAAVAMLHLPGRARAVGLAATGFALVGFLVGLSFTTLGGHVPDIAYHVTLLPVFAATIIVLLRMGKGATR
jgi:hypothetical protein